MEELSLKQWKSIVDYENYEISNKGRVRVKERKTVDKNGKIMTFPSKYLKVRMNGKTPFFVVSLGEWGNRKQLSLIEVMAEAFLDYNKETDVACCRKIGDKNITIDDIFIEKDSEIGVLYETVDKNWKEIKKRLFFINRRRGFFFYSFCKKIKWLYRS